MIKNKLLVGVHCMIITWASGAAVPDAISTDPAATFLFSHGIANTKKQALQYTPTAFFHNKTYKNDHYVMWSPVIAFNYPDATEKFWRINFWKSSLGQDSELSELMKAYNFIGPQKDIILWGVSRGASAAFNFLALNNQPNIKAAVLESPYDLIQSVVDHQFRSVCAKWKPTFSRVGHRLMEIVFRNYKKNGFQPLNLAHKINKDIPILFVCTHEDHRIPVGSTMNLYKHLRSLGHQHVHILQLPEGKHSYIILGECACDYKNVVHAFYKKYNLAHNPTFAAQGEELFLQCQPELAATTKNALV